MKVFLLDSIVLSSKLIFSSCYLDRIEGDAENDDAEPMNSDDWFQILASLWDEILLKLYCMIICPRGWEAFGLFLAKHIQEFLEFAWYNVFYCSLFLM